MTTGHITGDRVYHLTIYLLTQVFSQGTNLVRGLIPPTLLRPSKRERERLIESVLRGTTAR